MVMETTVPGMISSDLLRTDPDLLDIVQEFLDGIPTRIAELQAAFAAKNFETLEILAHRLKGAGGSYGYAELSALGAMMEQQFKAHSAGGFPNWMKQLEQLSEAAKRGLPVAV